MVDELVERAKKAINAVFSDSSVDKETTKDRLTTLADEIDMLLEALD
jgi:hypothetical protein